MTDAGHNSDPGGKKKEFVKRFVKLFEDQKELAEEIRDLGKEASDAGLTPKVLKELAKQELDPKRRANYAAFTEAVDDYRAAMGQFA